MDKPLHDIETSLLYALASSNSEKDQHIKDALSNLYVLAGETTSKEVSDDSLRS